MASRLALQLELEAIVPNVYFQPPESIRLTYPCIIYSLNRIENTNADNAHYSTDISYNITIISRNPEEPAVMKVNEFEKCRFDRYYTADNLHHTIFTLYY